MNTSSGTPEVQPKTIPGCIDRLLSEKHVIQLTSLSKATIRREVRAKRFPAPFSITEGRVAWSSLEVLEWIGARARRS